METRWPASAVPTVASVGQKRVAFAEIASQEPVTGTGCPSYDIVCACSQMNEPSVMAGMQTVKREKSG